MVYDIYYKTNIMKERLDETNKMRRLMDLPLITEQMDPLDGAEERKTELGF